MRSGEVPGREYLFVTRDKMEADVSAGKFIESGEYKGHLYGTSAESVKAIVNTGRVCVLSPHYQAIKSLRTPQLKPFIIHIRTPPFDRLKMTREENRARSTFDELNSRGFTVIISIEKYFSFFFFFQTILLASKLVINSFCFLSFCSSINKTKNKIG